MVKTFVQLASKTILGPKKHGVLVIVELLSLLMQFIYWWYAVAVQYTFNLDKARAAGLVKPIGCLLIGWLCRKFNW